MNDYDATGGEQGWIMKSKLNELRLDAGIARIENQQWLCVLDKETGMMVDPLIGLEKFALLIIRECARIAIEKQTKNDVLNIVSENPAKDFAYALVEHFGVEE
jgi:hypothetical protein